MKAAVITPRGDCPSLPKPMPTGDGLLARLAPTAPLSPDQLAGLSGLARELGNGVMEVTARGKLQLRGLTSATAPRLAEAVHMLGIAVKTGLAVETSGLPGFAVDAAFDPRPLAAEIEERAAAFAGRLAPKVSVVVDAGGALNLAALSADIALSPAMPGRLSLALAGSNVGTVAEAEAAMIAADLLKRLATQGPAARMSALLHGEDPATLRTTYGIAPDGVPAVAPAEPIGMHALKPGGVALGIGLAFGHGEAARLDMLAHQAAVEGVTAIEPAAGRALLLSPLTPESASRLREKAVALGFITDPRDPRRRVFACAGRPACGSAMLETRTVAVALAPLLQDRTLHVSGCTKGCAHPASTDFALVGLDEGVGIVVEGSPRAAPALTVALARLEDTMRAMLMAQAGD